MLYPYEAKPVSYPFYPPRCGACTGCEVHQRTQESEETSEAVEWRSTHGQRSMVAAPIDWGPFLCILRGYLFLSPEWRWRRCNSLLCHHSFSPHWWSACSVPSNKSGKRTLRPMLARCDCILMEAVEGLLRNTEQGMHSVQTALGRANKNLTTGLTH